MSRIPVNKRKTARRPYDGQPNRRIERRGPRGQRAGAAEPGFAAPASGAALKRGQGHDAVVRVA